MDEMVALVLVTELIEDAIDIEVTVMDDSVVSKVGLVEDVAIEWLFVVCVLSLSAKIKDKTTCECCHIT